MVFHIPGMAFSKSALSGSAFLSYILSHKNVLVILFQLQMFHKGVMPWPVSSHLFPACLYLFNEKYCCYYQLSSTTWSTQQRDSILLTLTLTDNDNTQPSTLVPGLHSFAQGADFRLGDLLVIDLFMIHIIPCFT